ncbi:ABC transporter ATP-binding protein [Deinococcus soli (ex Cha et al. 2016)]|uniref:ATP-binding cassette subfamily B protein n=2 Tax=Deinococcus soli (ex Cha et al. 2016) TaxID=1309411 RepID=A0AAE3XKU8_9DEIO|nr:ABC transporter ATP-binding protein [Deinococcus soli (ex Cha et al. 2016)]MDR6221443.1 ATP-binding cassette subfamily B protein [Deinococcus soli (ex Cha et al. 2016)]MDR6331428.1 ATP-binding cassette subfamily B protein [Deinococcus soli (ex Cha et al. 2016)]MDR6754587.1 ATP-binding cassette subfamily B protein [Deinococcus soli (ex Cha et al. 2016)]
MTTAPRFLLSRVAPYRWWMMAVLLFTLGTAVAGLAQPMIIRMLVSQLGTPEAVQSITQVTLVLIGALLVKAGCDFLANWLGHHVAWWVCHDTRTLLYEKVQRLSMRHVHDRNSADIHSRIVKDTENLEPVIADIFADVLVKGLTFIGGAAALFYLSPVVGLLALIPLPLLFYVISRLGQGIYRRFDQEMSLGDEMQRTALGNLHGLKEIQLFNREAQELERFRQRSAAYASAQVKTRRFNALFSPTVALVSGLGTVAAVWFGGHAAAAGRISSADLIAILMYLGFFYQPVSLVAEVNEFVQRATASINRIQDLLNLTDELRSGAQPYVLGTAPQIEFRDVHFSYSTEQSILKGVTFSVRAGATVGIVGPTGAGKSTLSHLLSRLYDVDQGAVLFDGVDLRDYRLDELRRSITIVPQDVYLFDGTILDNLLFACPSATFDEIREAASLAQAHQFIAGLPEGYHTQVGERGVKLSGGQKQRLALARALLKNAGLLILDEATSAVDTRTEGDIQEALRQVAKGRTAVVIAHRLSTVVDANWILVMDQGRIVEQGSHTDLLALRGLYADLYRQQSGEGVPSVTAFEQVV